MLGWNLIYYISKIVNGLNRHFRIELIKWLEMGIYIEVVQINEVKHSWKILE